MNTEDSRALGRVEGQLEGIMATLQRESERSAARDKAVDDVVGRLAALERHQQEMIVVTQRFNALQQAIRDGKMQGRGVLIGIGLAGGASGAALAAFFKTIWAAVFGS